MNTLEYKAFFFFSISLTVGASRFMETHMDLSCLLFGVGIFSIVTPQMFFSPECVENVRG